MRAVATALWVAFLASPPATLSQTMSPPATRSQTMLPPATRSQTMLPTATLSPTMSPPATRSQTMPPTATLSRTMSPEAVHSAAAPGPGLEVTLTPRQVTVGDRVEAVLTLRLPAAALVGEPRFPVFQDHWGDAEVLARSDAVRVWAVLARVPGAPGGAMVTYRQRLVLAAFHPGRIALPPVAAAVPEKSATIQAPTPADLAFEVRSVLPASARDAKPKPPAPMRPLPIGAAFWSTLAALFALALAGAWALWRRRSRQAAGGVAAAPRAAPYPELMAELDRLTGERSSLLVHTGLSFALRRYLGRSLELPATESTTTEIHRLLQGRRVPPSLLRRTIELLRSCDVVKFARLEAPVESGRQRIAAARTIAGDLAEMLRPRQQAAPVERLEATG